VVSGFTSFVRVELCLPTFFVRIESPPLSCFPMKQMTFCSFLLRARILFQISIFAELSYSEYESIQNTTFGFAIKLADAERC
jgi:hypothetical protein